MKSVRAFWSETELAVWPEAYVLVSLPPACLRPALALLAEADGCFAQLILERRELCCVLPQKLWRHAALQSKVLAEDGPYAVITLEAELDPDLVGFLAPAAGRLAAAGVPIVPQGGFRTDHIMVPERQVDQAVQVLREWIQVCRQAPS